MNQLECDVIRDLLPSYVDEICSEATKQCVEGHLRDCPKCDRLARQLRDTDFSTHKLEQREFDGYKKAKRQMGQQGISSALLAVSLVFSAIAGSWLLVHGGGVRSVPTYYALLSICIVCTIYFAYVHRPSEPIQKADRSMARLSVLGTLYLTWFIVYSLEEFETGRIPFGVAIGRYGVFARYQLNAVAVIQMVMYVFLLRRLVKKKINTGWILCLCMTGACVSHLYETFLGSMDLSFEGLKDESLYVMSIIAVALGIGFIGMVISLFLSRVQKRKAF